MELEALLPGKVWQGPAGSGEAEWEPKRRLEVGRSLAISLKNGVRCTSLGCMYVS